jgi:chromosome segregation ATPase
VGVDHQYERDMKMHKKALADLESLTIEADGLLEPIKQRIDELTSELGKLAQEQDSFMVQKHQFEEQLQGVGPNAVKDEEESEMLRDLIAELDENSAAIDEKVKTLMAEDNKTRLQLAGRTKALENVDQEIEEHKEQITILEDTLKVDPGIPVIKVSGTVHAKTEVSGLYKSFIIPQTMTGVRIFETESSSGGKHQIKISKL